MTGCDCGVGVIASVLQAACCPACDCGGGCAGCGTRGVLGGCQLAWLWAADAEWVGVAVGVGWGLRGADVGVKSVETVQATFFKRLRKTFVLLQKGCELTPCFLCGVNVELGGVIVGLGVSLLSWVCQCVVWGVAMWVGFNCWAAGATVGLGVSLRS